MSASHAGQLLPVEGRTSDETVTRPVEIHELDKVHISLAVFSSVLIYKAILLYKHIL